MNYVAKKTPFTAKDGNEYELKPPKARFISKVMVLQNKGNPKSWEESDWGNFIDVFDNILEKSYPEWDEDTRTSFILENFQGLDAKLPVIMGMVTEEQLDAALKRAEKKDQGRVKEE